MFKIRRNNDKLVEITQTIFFVKHAKQRLVMLGFMEFLIACVDSNKPNAELQQVFDRHREAVSMRNQADAQLAKIIKGDSLILNKFKTEIDSIHKSLKTWDEELIEVPGFEHEHDHSEIYHDHNHHVPLDLSPTQHLEVQEHLLKEIQTIAVGLSK